MATVTIRDVAKYAGVGVGTVSRVLNEHESVSQPTREKVLYAINALNYSPSPVARSLSSGKTMTIGVIVPFFTNPSYVERLRGIESVLADSEYDLVLYNAETITRRDKFFRNVPRRERVDGLLVITHRPADQDVTRFIEMGIPTVLIDSLHPRLPHIVIDDFLGAYKATQHLIKLGHQRIAHISDYMEGALNFQPVSNRYKGYRQALNDANLPFSPDYHQQGIHGRLQAREMAHKLFALPEPPTAVFAYSDTQAIGVLEAAREADIAVPKALAVVGFDDIEAAEYWGLTTIRQPLFESGACGCQKLLTAMEASIMPEAEEITLDVQLVVRDTTGQFTGT